jgi:hypothetical protein
MNEATSSRFICGLAASVAVILALTTASADPNDAIGGDKWTDCGACRTVKTENCNTPACGTVVQCDGSRLNRTCQRHETDAGTGITTCKNPAVAGCSGVGEAATERCG